MFVNYIVLTDRSDAKILFSVKLSAHQCYSLTARYQVKFVDR